MKVHIPGNRLPSPAVSLLQMLFSALMGTLSLILLLIFGIRTQEAGYTFFNPLYANLIICSLFCSAIARPATILQTIESYDFDPRYCTAYAFVLELETVGIPLAVLSLIVERMVYFSCLPLVEPLQSYKKRLRGAWKILLVALPWIAGVLFAFVKTFGLLRPIVPFGDVTRGLNDTDRYYYSCHLEGRSQKANSAGEGLLFSFRSGLPFVCFCVAIAVMAVYWYKAYSVVNPSPEPEDEVDSSKCIAQSKNEGTIPLLQSRNRYDETNNSVFPIKEDKSQNLPSQINLESIQNGSSCQSVDSAIEDSGDATIPNINVQIESDHMGGVQRRTFSQDEEITETHEPKPTTQETNTQVENHLITGIQRRTFSQETTETHDPKPTSRGHVLDYKSYDPLLPEPADKTNATVFIVIILALTCACVAVGGSIMVKYYGWLYESTQWLYFGLEFTAVLLAYCCIPEVTRRVCFRRCTYGDQDWIEFEMKQQEMSNLSTSGYSSPTSERGDDSLYNNI